MDFDSIKNQVSNLSLYDLKAGVRKVQNAVMNLTDMEAKVREATNADPWGAPSSLMMEIASGTHNYQQLNEIMPMIYKRFTDKTAEEWRQIYKALQLLEFLVKNGSERVVDDARSHLSLLRMLRQFHYIDQNGKDQGINVRNRSAELAKLLSDVEAIRAERKKAKVNKNKYGGVEGGSGLGFSSGGGNRYGGFGSESAGYGGYTGEVYGDGGGFGGRETDFSGTQRRGDQFEEYDEGDDEPTTTKRTSYQPAPAVSTKRELPKPKEPEQDLFDFGDEEPVTMQAGKAPVRDTIAEDDDDFDDFQSATPAPASATAPAPAVATLSGAATLAALSPPPTVASTTTTATQFAAPKPLQANQAANFENIFSTVSRPASTASAAAPAATLPTPVQLSQAQQYKPSGPNYYTSVPAAMNTTSSGTPASFTARPTMAASQPSYTSSTSAASLGKPAPKAAASSAGGDAFGSLWSSASSKAGVQSKPVSRGPDLASMAKAKSEAGIWGAPAGSGTAVNRSTPTATPAGQSKPAQSLGNGLDDLLG